VVPNLGTQMSTDNQGAKLADTDNIPELLTIDQLAERLGVTERYVRRLVAERRVPYRKLGKLIRFADHEIAQWLDTTRRPQRRNGQSA
jgi:excisionase family DNA binding protein